MVRGVADGAFGRGRSRGRCFARRAGTVREAAQEVAGPPAHPARSRNDE